MKCDNENCGVCSNPDYEKEQIDFMENHAINKTNNLLIDVGSHVGLYCEKLYKYMDNMIAFEPDLSCDYEDFENLKRLPFACSDDVEYLSFHGNGVMAYTEKQCDGNMICAIDIDSLNLPDYDNLFLKIDVEGAEYKALLGATKTIKNAKSVCLVVEHHEDQDRHHNQNRDMILGLLQNFKLEKYGTGKQIKIMGIK